MPTKMKGTKSIFLEEDDIDDQDIFLDALKEIVNTNLFAIANNGIEALYKLRHSLLLLDIIL